VDENIFDIANLFKLTESDIMNPLVSSISSAKAVLKKKKNREGYADDMPLGMFKTLTVKEFLELE